MTTVRADVVILTALPEEQEAVRRAIGSCAVHPWRGYRVYTGRVGALDVLVFPMGGMGNVGAAQAATLVIGVWNPAYLLLVGIAGGMREEGDDVRLGDVLVADQIIGYESAKVRPEGIDRRYQAQQPDWRLLQTARGLEPREWALSLTAARPYGQSGRVIPRAHFGPVLSGATCG